MRDTVTRQRTVRAAAHHAAGHDPPVPMRGLCPRVAPGHQQAAASRAKLSRRAPQWALQVLVCQHLSVARGAEALAVS